MKTFDKDNIKPATVKKIQKAYTSKAEFEPDQVRKVNRCRCTVCG